MAPEQLLDSRGATGAADIYALGAILYRAASGQQVFGNLDDLDYAKKKLISPPTPLELPRFDRAAKGLQSVVARALAKNPTGRFATAEAMKQELIALRDVARSLAMDLDAPTDMAPLSELLADYVGRSSRPSGEGVQDEPTLVDADDVEEATLSGVEATKPRLSEEPTTLNTAAVVVETPVASTPSTTVASAPSPSPSPSFPAAPETTRTLAPAATNQQRILLSLAIFAGAVIGFLAHWALTAAHAMP
jgi:serine/threonine-protein kinase